MDEYNTIDEETLQYINKTLQKVIKNITFPVAIRLIQSTLIDLFPNKNFKELYTLLLFKASPSLAFQRSDIQEVVFLQHENSFRVEIIVNFLSIFGASSPLPTHYNERVLDDSYNDKILLDFLDMLNHRLKKLIYPIWERHRYYVVYDKNLDDNFSKYILSILGLYSQYKEKGGETSLNLHKLLPFSGILSMHQKSTVSLLTILKHYFEHEDIEIEEGIIAKSHLPKTQHFNLGENNSHLGENTCIGSFILSRNLKFKIHFKNISWLLLEDFTLNHKKRSELFDLVRLIQNNPLDYEVALSIPKREIKPCLLGKENSYLGANIWIGELQQEQTILLSN
ncbi:MAG: type VI secretion system baseplate subunit TssG [Sulfurovum sp.]|nr:type VI secretion system baseplate subunit TssG [Sulfurovum sp.]